MAQVRVPNIFISPPGSAVKQSIFIEIVDENAKSVLTLNRFQSYTITREYEWISDTFSCVLVAEPWRNPVIKAGYYMNWWIDGVRDFMGIIETVAVSVTKAGVKTTISGRSRASILVSNYIKFFHDYPGPSNLLPYQIIEDIIEKTDFLQSKKWAEGDLIASYQDMQMSEIKRVEAAQSLDLEVLNMQMLTVIEGNTLHFTDEFKALSLRPLKTSPGMTVWQALQILMRGTGMQVFINGQSLVFGKLSDFRSKGIDGKNLANYSIQQYGAPAYYQTATSSSKRDSIVNRYSEIRVVAQSSSAHYRDASEYTDNLGIATDSTLTSKKPFLHIYSGGTKTDPDGKSDMDKLAIKIRDDQRISGFSVHYTVPYHISNNGEPWRLNRFCNVYDEILGIYEKLVIYGVTYKFDINSGTTTELSLSYDRQDGVQDI